MQCPFPTGPKGPIAGDALIMEPSRSHREVLFRLLRCLHERGPHSPHAPHGPHGPHLRLTPSNAIVYQKVQCRQKMASQASTEEMPWQEKAKFHFLTAPSSKSAAQFQWHFVHRRNDPDSIDSNPSILVVAVVGRLMPRDG